MALIASLVVGANNATTLGGDSQKLSTPPDRTRFLGLHRSAAAIIVGKNSAVHEDYRQTQVPIFIFSRSEKQLPLSHPSMQQILIDGDLAERSRQIEDQILGDVVVEAGPQLLAAMISAGVIEILYLSISPINGDDNFLDLPDLLSKFVIESEELVEGTRLLECRYNSNTANS